jgi:hypothetical protein
MGAAEIRAVLAHLAPHEQVAASTQHGALHALLLLYQFEIMPLFAVFIEVVVDPSIVDDWAFPGWDGGDIGHTWRITACKQEKSCR